MGLPRSLADRIAEDLRLHCATEVRIQHVHPLGGGSINDAYRLDTDVRRFFVKTNHADRYPSMFEAEADGLGRLRAAGAIRVPEVIAFGEVDDESYLLLEHVDGGARSTGFWQDFGRSLALLHRNTSERFGLERDNYIGSLVQVNTLDARWDEFFIHCRLEPLVRMARDADRIGMGEVLRFERLYVRLGALLPPEAPALLHGDLWSGNFLAGPAGEPVLIDPAVYYGHREMDLAMTRLFGGFEPIFHEAYHDTWPMEVGWEERMDLCNLYPLLVHVNLFGGGYARQVDVILRRFVRSY